MLLAPEFDQRRGEPPPNRQEPVDAGVAGGTQRDQPGRIVDTGTPVMNMQAAGRPADTASPIALENAFPIAGKVRP